MGMGRYHHTAGYKKKMKAANAEFDLLKGLLSLPLLVILLPLKLIAKLLFHRK